VSMTAIAWADYFQKLPATVSNGKAPDVGLMHSSDLATNAARRVISPLDDVAKALNLTKNDFASIAWDGGLYQGQRYGIPLDTHPAALYYNKNVMAKAGLDPDNDLVHD
jgi:multiple sugar transport system substrate-binding protein